MQHSYALLRRKPSAALAGAVSDLAIYEELAPASIEMREHASLVVPLVIGFGAPFHIALGCKPRAEDAHVSFAAGLTSQHVEIASSGGAYCLQVNFTPVGARRFFALPMNELAGAMVDPVSVLGPPFERLRQMLGNETCKERMFDTVEAYIVSRLARAAPARGDVLRTFSRMTRSSGTLPIGMLAELADVSRKHLNRLFLDEFGLPPKTVSRILRFQRAKDCALQSSHADWSMIAAECGFADQAHLIREFRAFSGQTPTALQSSS